MRFAEAFAVLVVAPVALIVLRGHRGLAVVIPAMVAALALAAIGLVLPAGTVAGMLATPWLLFAGFTAIRRGPGELRKRSGPAFVTCAALAFWVVGAGWLLCERADIQPLGFSTIIVSLTAVHFHVAGLGGLTIGAVVAAASPNSRVPVAAALLAAAGIAIVAAGITGPQAGMPGLVALQAVGGAVTGAGFITVAVFQLREPHRRGLRLASLLSVVAGMALAVWFSLGNGLAIPAPSLSFMLRTHGILNGVGFALCGLVSWLGVPSSDPDQM